jgi:protein SCO1/2
MLRIFVPLFLLAALALGLLLQLSGGAPARPDTHAVLLDETRGLPDFTLLDHFGHAFTPDSFRGEWHMVFFGFTHCPDICPETMVQMNLVHRQLEQGGNIALPRVVFVSVDPVRDTPEQLARYVPYFNESFVGVTGDPEMLDRLSRAMAVPVVLPDGEPDGDYLVDHGASLTLVDPNGHIRAFFTTPHHVDRIAADYRNIVHYLEATE